MRKIKQVICIASVTSLMFLSTNCGKTRTGVCTGFSTQYNSTYCKDGWTEEECDEWNDIQANGVSWHFHAGQTCAERGTPATQ
jgi:hypothetical protein